MSVCALLFKAGLCFGHHLEGERKRDRRGKRVYKAAAAGGVKNRQLHRQSRMLKVFTFKGEVNAAGGKPQTAKRPTEVIKRLTKRLKRGREGDK